MRSIHVPHVHLPTVALPLSIADAFTAPMRRLNEQLNQLTRHTRYLTVVSDRLVARCSPFVVTTGRRTGEPDRLIDWHEVERQWWEERRAMAAPKLSPQARYDQWVAGRSCAPTQCEDRDWGLRHGVSQRSVDKFRSDNRDPRLHRRGRRPK